MLFNGENTKGKFSLLNESRSMLSMALSAIGSDANSDKQEEINKAVDYILQVKSNPDFGRIGVALVAGLNPTSHDTS